METIEIMQIVISGIAGIIIGAVIGFVVRNLTMEDKVKGAHEQAERIVRDTERELENRRKEVEIEAKDKPILTALNKIDKIEEPSVIERAKGFFNSTVAISALNKESFGGLINEILSHISGLMARVLLTIPASDAKTLNLIYENGLVIKREYKGESLYIEAEVPTRIKEMLEKRV